MDLKLDHVYFSYPGGFRVEDVDLRIPTGGFIGLIGPNGSGKSTLLALMSGTLKPTRGEIRLDDVPVSRFHPRGLARKMAVISAEQYFDFPFLVRDVVAMGRFPHSRRLRWETQEDEDIVSEVLRLTDLSHFARRPISQLSTGERQRALIARAMAQQPSVMLLDEPDAHLDLHHQLNIFRLLQELNRQRKITIVAVLHDLTAAAAFCRELALLNQGRLISYGKPADVITGTAISEVYGQGVVVSLNPVTQTPMVSIVDDADQARETR